MKLSPKLVLVVAFIAAILEVLQRQVLVTSSVTHTVIGLVLMFTIGVGIVPLTAEQLGKLVPQAAAVALTSLAGVLQVLQQENLGSGVVVHEVIGIALIFLAAFHIAPPIAKVIAGRLAAPGVRR